MDKEKIISNLLIGIESKSNNGLDLLEINTRIEKGECISWRKEQLEVVKALQNLDQLKNILDRKNSNSGYFIVYLDYKVLLGKWEFRGNPSQFNLILPFKIDFSLKFLQKLRIFNENFEILIFRSQTPSGRIFKWRLREDLPSSDSAVGFERNLVIDNQQVLWGTKYEPISSGQTWGRLIEKRGIEIIVPFGQINVTPQKPVFLKIRNYIGYHHETHQAYYYDCRFRAFELPKNQIRE